MSSNHLPVNAPEPEVTTLGSPQDFRDASHARNEMDGVRGIEIVVGIRDHERSIFLPYDQAARLLESLRDKLAFLDQRG